MRETTPAGAPFLFCLLCIACVINSHSATSRRATTLLPPGCSNFAGMLIVWDRLFGTFEPEQPSVACLYGLDAQVRTGLRLEGRVLF